METFKLDRKDLQHTLRGCIPVSQVSQHVCVAEMLSAKDPEQIISRVRDNMLHILSRDALRYMIGREGIDSVIEEPDRTGNDPWRVLTAECITISVKEMNKIIDLVAGCVLDQIAARGYSIEKRFEKTEPSSKVEGEEASR